MHLSCGLATFPYMLTGLGFSWWSVVGILWLVDLLLRLLFIPAGFRLKGGLLLILLLGLFFFPCRNWRLGKEGVVPHSVGGPLWFLVHLFIFVWAGPAISPLTRRQCWPLLEGVWRAIAPLMRPWCAEGEVPTAANLNLYG